MREKRMIKREECIMRTKIFEKLPGEAPKWFLPEIQEIPRAPVEIPEIPEGIPRIERPPTAPPPEEPKAAPAPTEQASEMQESVQAARAVLRPAMQATMQSERDSRETVKDFVRVLHKQGFLVYDSYGNMFSCSACGVVFKENALGEIKNHFSGSVEIPAADLAPLLADAKRARANAWYDYAIDRFSGDYYEGEILVAGYHIGGCFYRAVLNLSRGQKVKIVPSRRREGWALAHEPTQRFYSGRPLHS
jgi:hypothetical protein